ncbi:MULTISPECIES: DUF4334 domain-containing protein [Mycobacteriaceae]|uniref:DUF4334 domain-containing protein n=1 Tax=Mycolicibacterium setense TaxID=431269 RepID=A0ABR4YMU6_9MYCO|nr:MULTISPECIES: DUF4334 domain-containing protein [Mycobacteriaceae]KHO20020.1 hypothetical protein QQ44_25800 [Mycolicibacterium setense]KHO21140.1 hypothetical protein QQ25_10765 [Mycolicibacterium setense]MCV7111849.1 DUF4334 domain-containing protein [Mycolicibacterium setense]
MSDARGTFDGFVSREGQIPDAELDAFWAVLAPAGINFMLGEWKGGAFDTGHPVSGLLKKANWFGKTMTSPNDVQPIVCLDEAGNKFNNEKLSKGGASLWLEEFRGEVTATMVYDGQAIHDHFKKVDDTTVMGIMNGKAGLQDGRYGYFYLQRV